LQETDSVQNLATWFPVALAFCFAMPVEAQPFSPTALPAPSIYSIDPSSGPGGIPVTIIGYGFSGANIVHFGKISIPDVPIAWQVGIVCVQGKPACHSGINQALNIIIPGNQQPGTYGIFVENANGASNILRFTIMLPRRGGAR
jgi:hypothetical protein